MAGGETRGKERMVTLAEGDRGKVKWGWGILGGVEYFLFCSECPDWGKGGGGVVKEKKKKKEKNKSWTCLQLRKEIRRKHVLYIILMYINIYILYFQLFSTEVYILDV